LSAPGHIGVRLPGFVQSISIISPIAQEQQAVNHCVGV
jgi:hypothetical protein